MSGAINRRELSVKSLSGLAGGALGWLPVELASHGHTLTEAQTAASLISGFVSMALLAGLIGGFITAAEGQSLELTSAVERRFLRGFLICFFLSLPTTYYADLAFGYILNLGGWGVNHPGSALSLIIGRAVSWMSMGAMLGVGVGLASFSLKNIVKGAAGGWIGGFIGGLAFDLIGATMGGLLSRLFGLSAVGLSIGLFIGLVQELTKTAWLTVEAGRLRGRQYRLERATSGVGRAEENPVGLFGDTRVQPRHAVIERHGSTYILRNLAVQEGTFLNGRRIESVELHQGDRITMGDYELSFHTRAGAAETWMAPAAQAVETAAADVGSLAPCLVSAAGERFPIRRESMTRLGRALDNDIVIPHASVSRHHASITACEGIFELHDLNSQNGTFVGEKRITEARIAEGDSLRFGDAAFIFHVSNGE